MTDSYQYTVYDHGVFFAGYCEGKAVVPAKMYLFDGLRMVRIISGSGSWKIGNAIHEVGMGDLLLFNNITPRQIVSIRTSPFRFEVFGFSVGAVSGEPGFLNLFFGNTGLGSPIIPAATEGLDDVYALLDLLKKYMIKESSGVAVAAGLIKTACTIAGELAKKTGGQQEKTKLPSQTACRVMGEAIAYIEKNFGQIHDISEIADSIHVSRTYLYNLFSKYTGYTPRGYLNHCRILRFLDLITTRDTTVLDAAMHCGFESLSGFYKTFRSVCGTTPTAYLTQYREDCSGE